MFCGKCGYQIPDESLFCLKCGAQQFGNEVKTKRIYTFELFFTEHVLKANTNDENEMKRCIELYKAQNMKYQLKEHYRNNELEDRKYMYINDPPMIRNFHDMTKFGNMLKNHLIMNGWDLKPFMDGTSYLFIKEA